MVKYDPFQNARELKNRNTQRDQLISERKKLENEKKKVINKVSSIDIHNQKLIKKQERLIEELTISNSIINKIYKVLLVSNIILIIVTITNIFF